MLIGGHMDSVPNGGWLDGCLNVLAGAEVLRRIAEEGTPPVTVRLVDWADEEGARFGRSLFGSSAAAGRWPTRTSSARSPTATASGSRMRSGVRRRPRPALEARSQLDSAAATSSSTSSKAPCSSRSTCRSASCSGRSASSAAHHVDGAGGTCRVDPDGSAPRRARRRGKLALAIRDIARETGDGAVCTSGGVVCRPGIVTSVVETAEQLLDQRHLEAEKLAAMLARARSSRGVRGGGADRRRLGADLVDRADPLR